MRILSVLIVGVTCLCLPGSLLAMEKDQIAAAYKEAETLRKTAKSDADLMRALEIQQDLYDNGNRASLLRVAQLQMKLNQQEASFESFKTASENGSAYAQLLNATHHARGDFGDLSDPDQGMNALKTMAAAPDGAKAQLALAELYDVGIGGDKSQANAIFASLAAEGNPRAASIVLKKHEKSSTRIRAADVNAIVSSLEPQLEEGNRQAASVLARAYVRLPRYIPNARARHQDLVNSHLDLLPASKQPAELVSAGYNYRDHSGSARSLSTQLEPVDGEAFVQAAMRMRGIEKTAFVYLVQKELAAIDAFSGRANGKLTDRTIRSIFAFCRENGFFDTCKHGPINYDSSLLIARAIGAEKQKRLSQ